MAMDEFETLRAHPDTLVFTFGMLPSSLELFERTVKAHLALGFRTLSRPETVAGHHVVTVLLCVPPVRPNREERGCEL